MASVIINDLAASEALDRKAMQSIQGALCWVNGAFPCYVAPLPIPGAAEVFNFFQQITNNYTYVGQIVNQSTNIAINNSGDNSTNNVVALPSLGNVASKV